MVIENMTKVIEPKTNVARNPGCPYCRYGKYFGSGDCYHRIDVDYDDNPAICTHFQDGEDFSFGVEFAARIHTEVIDDKGRIDYKQIAGPR